MSAFIVDKTHIDALLTAGLSRRIRGNYGPMHWLVGEPLTTDFEPGEPWGPTSVESTQERRRVLDRSTANRVGTMLWAQNRRSVDFRYDENEPFEIYTYRELPGLPDPVIVLKAISCYEYQSCEDPGWEKSEAKAFCDALRHDCIYALPGIKDAPWDIHDRNVFCKRLPKTA